MNPSFNSVLASIWKVIAPGLLALFVTFGLFFGLSSGLILGAGFAFNYGLDALSSMGLGYSDVEKATTFLRDLTDAIEMTAENYEKIQLASEK
jgi:hypothetical protein